VAADWGRAGRRQMANEAACAELTPTRVAELLPIVAATSSDMRM